jgi:hypothetical protein
MDVDIDAEEILTDLSPPQNSPITAFLTVVSFLTGVYFSFQGVYRALPLALAISLFFLGLDGTWYLNQELQTKDKIEADYFISYLLGSILIFLGLLLSRQLHWYRVDLPFFSDFFIAFFGSLSIASVYVILLTLLMRRGKQQIVVRKDPYNPTDRYYVFTEEEYISRVEKNALEKANDE